MLSSTSEPSTFAVSHFCGCGFQSLTNVDSVGNVPSDLATFGGSLDVIANATRKRFRSSCQDSDARTIARHHVPHGLLGHSGPGVSGM
jgi:hypothetical protein